MSYGTAGLTAVACVKKILDANVKKDLPVIVSGATGGVGSISVGLLSKPDMRFMLLQENHLKLRY